MRSELEDAGFVALPNPRAPSGIYALLRNGVIVYIGKSKSVFWRIAQHNATIERKTPLPSRAVWFSEGDARKARFEFDEALVLFCPEGELDRLELEYIDRYRPKYNIVVRTPLPDLKIDIHALAAQMKWDLKLRDSSLDSLRQRKL